MRAYRLPDETIFEIERLAELWQCTQAEVIERALAMPPAVQVARGHVLAGPSELKVEYDVD